MFQSSGEQRGDIAKIIEAVRVICAAKRIPPVQVPELRSLPNRARHGGSRLGTCHVGSTVILERE